MKSIIISSNSSGGGKTTVTLALMQILKNRGYTVNGYKIGPDYIDPAFHKKILKINSKNLDLHLIGSDGVKYTYSNSDTDFGVVEGVMGLYDGKGMSLEASTYDISKTLDDLPIILVLNPKGKSTTIAAEIRGIINFKKPNITGIIFNCVSKSYYLLLKGIVEKYCGIPVLGFLPNDSRITIESRHLGLIQAVEIENLTEKIELLADLFEEHVDVDLLLNKFEKKDIKVSTDYKLKRNKGLRIAIAYDKAFNFYYDDNLKLLESIGDITYFSPLYDKSIPQNVNFIYMGGGYPEVFKEDLSANKSMLHSLKSALEDGVYCYAECGALMYLSQSIEDYEMVGLFEGTCRMTTRLQNFGYATMNFINNKNLKINCHEFHKSIFDTIEKPIYELRKSTFSGEEKIWYCGYKKYNTIATYAHINFLGNLDFLDYILPVNR